MSIVVETLEKLQLERQQTNPQAINLLPAGKKRKAGRGLRPYAILMGTSFVALTALSAAVYSLTDQPAQATNQNSTSIVASTAIAKKTAKPIEKQQPLPVSAPADRLSLPDDNQQAAAQTVAVINETTGTRAPDWLDKGYSYFHTGELKRALDHWQSGFSQLDKDKLLLSVHISQGEKSAVSMLEKLRRNQLDAFIVPAALSGKKAYYTLVLPTDFGMEQTQKRIQQTTGISSFKIRQSKFQPRIDALSNIEARLAESVTPPITPSAPRAGKNSTEQQAVTGAEQMVVSGRYAEAIERLKPFAPTSNRWQTHFWLGSAQLGLGQYALAEKSLQQAKRITNQVPQIWIQLAVAAQELGDHRKALSYLQSARQLAPNAPEILFNIGFSSDALGDRNGAVLAYREFLELSGGDSQYLQLRQSVLDRLRDLGSSNKRNF